MLEKEIKSIAGVVEAGIFTPRPIEVHLAKDDGTFRTLRQGLGGGGRLRFHRRDKFITGTSRTRLCIIMVHEVDYKTKAIDPAFLQKPEEFPPTGEHVAHKV